MSHPVYYAATHVLNYRYYYTAKRVTRILQWALLQPTGVWGRSPQRSKILSVFGKNNLILSLFWLKLMLLKRGIEISSAKTWLY